MPVSACPITSVCREPESRAYDDRKIVQGKRHVTMR